MDRARVKSETFPLKQMKFTLLLVLTIKMRVGQEMNKRISQKKQSLIQKIKIFEKGERQVLPLRPPVEII